MDRIIQKHLQLYDFSKLEVAMRTLMEQLAAILSRQCGIQYEFGHNSKQYSEKAARTLGESHFMSLSEILTGGHV